MIHRFHAWRCFCVWTALVLSLPLADGSPPNVENSNIENANIKRPDNLQRSLADSWGWPVAAAISQDHKIAYLSGIERGKLLKVSDQFPSAPVQSIALDADAAASRLIELQVAPWQSQLLAITDAPSTLSAIDLGDEASLGKLIDLPSLPCRLAVSASVENSTTVCVTLTWDKSVWVGSIEPTQRDSSEIKEKLKVTGKRLELPFAPKEVLSLGYDQFLVADAFGGKLAIVDAKTAVVVSTGELKGHHINGLAIGRPAETTTRAGRMEVLVTHQQLNPLSTTSRDDIHWGTLIQNVVTNIEVAVDESSALSPPTAPTSGTSDLAARDKSTVPSAPILIRGTLHTIRLGKAGRGNGDPAGVVLWSDQPGKEQPSSTWLAVALSGVDQVLFMRTSDKHTLTQSVGSVPSQLLPLGQSKFVCVNRLSGTVSILELGELEPSLAERPYTNSEPSDRMARVLGTIGEPREATTDQQRGQLAFYSARLSHDSWMSCNSCHVEGHSADLLTDTLSDGGFRSSPKRIPGLLNVAHTGPWSWLGNHAQLSEQIDKTLRNTMHLPPESYTQSELESLVSDLEAYLKVLKYPDDERTRGARAVQDLSAERIALGKLIFSRRCAECHKPQSQFTSPQRFELGIVDQLGNRQFNPPSLVGLRYRAAFFHDSRFQKLEQLLEEHPTKDASDDHIALIEYLLQL